MVKWNNQGFVWADYLVFSLVLVISAAIGLYHAFSGGRQKTKSEYLLGDRKLWVLPVGLSILVTFQSAILFIGVPAEVYRFGLPYLWFHIGVALSVVISATVFVPLLYPLQLTSTYEYLQLRFQSRLARVIGTLLGALNMILYTSVVVFAPATALEATTGFPEWASIVLVSAVAVFYTTLGGMKAVIWTDTFLFVIMLAGLIAIVVQGVITSGGFHNVIEVSRSRTDLGGFNPDPRTRHTIWSLVIGGTVTWLSNIGVNQSSVQRFSSVPSQKAAMRTLLVSLPGFVIWGVAACFVGLITFAYFSGLECDPLASKAVSNPNQLVPLYVVNVFEFLPGFAGLFTASLFSAALSTMSSNINGLAAMMWEDILKPKLGHFSDTKVTWLLKGLVVLFGVVCMCVSFIVAQIGGPATQIALSFFGASGGPVLGMFLLGALCPFVNWIGVSAGAVVSVGVTFWIAVGARSVPPHDSPLPPAAITNCSHMFNTTVTLTQSNATRVESTGLAGLYHLSYLWYSTIAIIIVFIIGMIVSILTGGCSKSQQVESKYLSCDRLCCCIPSTARHKLYAPSRPTDDEMDSMPAKDYQNDQDKAEVNRAFQLNDSHSRKGFQNTQEHITVTSL